MDGSLWVAKIVLTENSGVRNGVIRARQEAYGVSH